MARSIPKYPKIIGVRVTPADQAKLHFLCERTQCTSGELLRLLIRMAEPTNLPSLVFAATSATSHSQEMLAPVED